MVNIPDKEYQQLQARLKELEAGITERKKAEEKLRDAEIMNRTLLEGSPVCTKLIDRDFKLRYMSGAGVKDLKISDIEPYYGQTYPLKFFPESARVPLAKNLKIAMAGTLSSVEVPVHDIKGNVVWYFTTFVPTFDDDGRVKYVIGTSVNITERKKVEAEVEEWKNRYEAAVMTSGHILYDWDSKTNAVTYGGAVEGMLGYSMDEMADGLKHWVELIHPDDRAQFDYDIERLIATKKSANMEYRIRRKDGEYIHIEDAGSFIPDADGNLTCMIGFVKDVTKRKKVEEELRESWKSTRTIFDSMRDGVLIVATKEKKFIRWNKSICQVLGYAPEEIARLDIDAIHPVEDLPYVLEQFEGQTSGELPIAENIPIKRKDGSVFYADVCSSVALIEGRQCEIGVFRDITERKKAEKELEKHREHLEELVEEKTGELGERVKELETFYDASVDRELKMEEMRVKIKELESELKERSTL